MQHAYRWAHRAQRCADIERLPCRLDHYAPRLATRLPPAPYIVCQTPMEAQSCPSFTLPAFALPVQRVNRSGCRYRTIQVKKVRKETLFRRCLDCISLLKIIKFYSSFSSSFSKSTDRKRRHADLFCLANHRWQTRLCLRATAHRAAIQQPQRATGKALDPRD